MANLSTVLSCIYFRKLCSSRWLVSAQLSGSDKLRAGPVAVQPLIRLPWAGMSPDC